MINLKAVGYALEKYNLPNMDCLLLIEMLYRADFKGVDKYISRKRNDPNVLDNIQFLMASNIIKKLDGKSKSINFIDLELEESFVKEFYVSDAEVISELGYIGNHGVLLTMLINNSRYLMADIPS